MIYSSLIFIYGFLPVSLVIYYITPKKFRDAVLLILSLIFCGFFGAGFMIFIAGYVVFNYIFGIFTDKLTKGKMRIIPAAAGIIADLLVLLFARLDGLAFIRENMKIPEHFFPFGISLFTLSAIGYLVDIYCGRIRAEKNIVLFGLYIMMFPRLIMGPIVRYRTFSKISGNRRISLNSMGIGFTVFVKGLAKKILAADNLYMLYSAVKSMDIDNLSAINAWLGIIAYFLCLYFTLSGFADMGTGIGYCFGYSFPHSFSYPVFSSRIRYFAGKWHIQVIRWFRKYITCPLFSLTDRKWLKNIIFIFVWGIAGFWYGFSAGGAVWGICTGSAIIIENRFSSRKMLKATGIIYTFVLMVIFSVFLSNATISDSFQYLYAMAGGNGILADTLSVYLMRSYLVVLLAVMYASADLFRNMMIRISKTKLSGITKAVSPLATLFVLILCTALISCSGSSGMILIRL